MKNSILIIVLLFSISACNDQKSESADNQLLIKKYFTYFNAHYFKNMAEMYTEKAAFKDPSLGQSIVKQTHAEIIKKYSDLVLVFPDLKDKVIKMYPSGSKHIIVEFVSSGTAPDKSTFELPICTIFTFENGKISEDFTYYDNN